MNCILGTNYKLYTKEFPNFLESLRNTSFDGELVLFLDDFHEIEAIQYLNGLYDSTNKIKTKILPFPDSGGGFVTKRFEVYLQYLYEHPNYSNVMLTDIRDVIFQKDPFDFDIGHYVNCFAESNIIKNCRANSKWMKESFGDKCLNELGDHIIINAGVTIGSYYSIILYLENIVNCMKKNAIINDQAAHNYLIYNGKIKNIKIHYNHSSPVMTLAYINKNDIYYNKYGQIINYDGSIVNVLHQYYVLDQYSSSTSNLTNIVIVGIITGTIYLYYRSKRK